MKSLTYALSIASTCAVCVPRASIKSMRPPESGSLSLSSRSSKKLVFKNIFSNDSVPFAPPNISGDILKELIKPLLRSSDISKAGFCSKSLN